MPPELNIDFTKLSEVILIAIALVYLARTFMSFVNNTGKKDEREDGILKQMIDLATSYKQESAEARDAYKAEAAANRAVVQESNDVLRALMEATNIQTGEIRKLPEEIKLLRADFKDYQVINADEIEGFGLKLDAVRAEMVTFKGDIEASMKRMLEQITVTNDFVEQAVNEHQTIIETGKVLIAKADHIISLLPPPQPASVINITNTAAPDAAQSPADAAGTLGEVA